MDIFFDNKRAANVYLKEKIKRNKKIFNYNFLLFYTFTVLRILRFKSHYLQLPSTYEYNDKYSDKEKLKQNYDFVFINRRHKKSEIINKKLNFYFDPYRELKVFIKK